MKVFTAFIEWDSGYRGAIWASREAAERDLRAECEDFGEDFDDAVKGGLISIREEEVIQ